jgi:ABC-type Co2+ transport system permease subunit
MPMRRFGEHYVRGLGMATRNNGLAYGYSITATASFAVLDRTASPASVARIFLFILGNGIGFAVVSGLVTQGFRRRVDREPPVVLALATAFAVVSTSVGVGIAALVGWGIGGWASWLIAPLLSTWAYLSVAALEIALSRGLHEAVGDVSPEER